MYFSGCISEEIYMRPPLRLSYALDLLSKLSTLWPKAPSFSEVGASVRGLEGGVELERTVWRRFHQISNLKDLYERIDF